MTILRLALLPAALLAGLGLAGCPPERARPPAAAAPPVAATDARSAPAPVALSADEASRLARLALACVEKEYPNKLDHVMNDGSEVRTPSDLHPSFFGCYDWHSAVHGHWMLVRLLRLFPALPEAEEIRALLDRTLSADRVALEVAYLGADNRATFERTYGWAWLLKLAAELHLLDDDHGRRWRRQLAPLAQALRDRYLDFLPRQTYPIRRGVHPNTAFGIALALDYARSVDDRPLEALLVERAGRYFEGDAGCPAGWEPDGDDFFSPCLMVADLMRRVLQPKRFGAWLHRFLPELEHGRPRSLLNPVEVADRSDPKIVHLDGLNLSRAWCARGVAAALPQADAAREILLGAAGRHLAATLPHVTSGDYAGEHWLASFAVYALTDTTAP